MNSENSIARPENQSSQNFSGTVGRPLSWQHIDLHKRPFGRERKHSPISIAALGLRIFCYALFVMGTILLALVGVQEFGAIAMLGRLV